MNEGNELDILTEGDEGTGALTTGTPDISCAGIGGDPKQNAGTICIFGGVIHAQGGSKGSNAACIGGGSYGAGGTIVIEGGIVTACNGTETGGAGIGGGRNGAGGTITIDGGTVTATGDCGAGIGGGRYGAGGTVEINDGQVTATGERGAGIGGGEDGTGGTVTINDGQVAATGNKGAGIGGGLQGAGGTITINGGFVIATANYYGAGIGGGAPSANTDGPDAGPIAIHGGKVKAKSEKGYAIGPGKNIYNTHQPGKKGPVTLGWTSEDDYIEASVIMADPYQFDTGKVFQYADETSVYDLVTEENLPEKPASYRLVPCIPTSQELSKIASIRMDHPLLQYTGNLLEPEIAVETVVGATLRKGTDYTVTYSPGDVREVGSYTLTVTGMGDYQGSLTAEFWVGENMDAQNLSQIAHVTVAHPVIPYTGSPLNQEITVETVTGDILREGTDYTVVYTPGMIKERGAYTLTVTGMGDYYGRLTADFMVTEYTHQIDSSTLTWSGGDYYVTGEVTLDERVTVSGTVNLLLCDGAVLNAVRGISVEGDNRLVINGGDRGSGRLEITNPHIGCAGIGGGSGCSAGTIIINGGNISVSGTSSAPGIGNGKKTSGGVIIINGGDVQVTSGTGGAGIGGGKDGSAGIITINGGVVSAIGGEYGAGIGGGQRGSGGKINIYGGAVTATGGLYAAGIGGGGNNSNTVNAGAAGTISIHGGRVTARSIDRNGLGIGPGRNEKLKSGESGVVTLGWKNESDYIYVSTIEAARCTLEKPLRYARGASIIGVVRADNLSGIPENCRLVPLVVSDEYDLSEVGTIDEYSLYPYTETIPSPEVKTIFGQVLREGTDYTVAYDPQTITAVGEYTMTITGTGRYHGSVMGRVVVYDPTHAIGSDTQTLSNGSYYARGDVTNNNRILVQGTVKLYLEDGAKLTVPKGITVEEDNRLEIYGGNENGGELLVANSEKCSLAGVGGTEGNAAGTIVIYGGRVTTTGGTKGGAGIGGGVGGAGGNITINGGIVTATGGTGGGAGIGGGKDGAGGNIIINSGTITSTGVTAGAGIGGGGAGGDITIGGGTILAFGSIKGAGIGGGNGGFGGEITISGGEITASSIKGGAGIGGGFGGDGGHIRIKNGTITATGGGFGAGIGGGQNGAGESITIEGGTINATGGYKGAGIGGGQNGTGGDICIKNGTITATGGDYGAGIGGGYKGDAGNITIEDGIVTATGNCFGADIGGGGYDSVSSAITPGSGGTISILGGQVTALASGSKIGYGIGPGRSQKKDGKKGTVTISWKNHADFILTESIVAENYVLNKDFRYYSNGEKKALVTVADLPTKSAGDWLIPDVSDWSEPASGATPGTGGGETGGTGTETGGGETGGTGTGTGGGETGGTGTGGSEPGGTGTGENETGTGMGTGGSETGTGTGSNTTGSSGSSGYFSNYGSGSNSSSGGSGSFDSNSDESGSGSGVTPTDPSTPTAGKDPATGTNPAVTPGTSNPVITKNPDGSTTTTTTTIGTDGSSTVKNETVKTGDDGTTEKTVKTETTKTTEDGKTEIITETNKETVTTDADGKKEITTETTKETITTDKDGNVEKSTETVKETIKSDGSKEKTSDIEKADGTTIHEEVKTNTAGRETSRMVETAPGGDKTVTEQVTQPSGDYSKVAVETKYERDEDGNITGVSVTLQTEQKTGETIQRTSYVVLDAGESTGKSLAGNHLERMWSEAAVAGALAGIQDRSIAAWIGKQSPAGNNSVALTSATTTAKNGRITIPKTVKADGVTYTVTTLKKGILKENNKKPSVLMVKAVGITKVEAGAFSGIKKNAVIKIKANKSDYKRIKKLIKKSGLPKSVKIKRA